MSVYSGFATRQQECFYNKLLERMIQLLAVKLIQLIKTVDELLGAKKQDSPGRTSPKHTELFQISPEAKEESPAVLAVVGLDTDKKWLMHVGKIYKAIYNMDKQKYLEPKFSTSIYPVIKFLHKRYGLKGMFTNISKTSISQREGVMNDT